MVLISEEEKRLMEWLSKALEIIERVDEYGQSEDWRRDVAGLRDRFYNRASSLQKN